MRCAVTGSRGRVGRALVAVVAKNGHDVVEWNRPEFDLDEPHPAALVARDAPDVVFHCAAWTDVDACARRPALAMQRNGTATARLADACADASVGLVYLSTNEVFDGLRDDGQPYAEDDVPAPANAYGASKLAGEDAVRRVLNGGDRAWIVRTSWVFGGGSDFPAKVIAGVRGLRGDDALAMVSDEMGRPTHAADLADALVRLTQAEPGTYHLANDGYASRFEWARAVLDRCAPDARLSAISLDDYARPSRPPRWGVLGTGRATSVGIVMAPWRDALARYLDELCQS